MGHEAAGGSGALRPETTLGSVVERSPRTRSSLQEAPAASRCPRGKLVTSEQSLDLTSRQAWYIFYTKMEFEFDPRKSEGNKQKHGINFVEAQALWLDVNRIEIPARTVDEPRTLVIGRSQDQHWSAIVTYREDRIRIISVRRSRTEEVGIYEGEGV